VIEIPGAVGGANLHHLHANTQTSNVTSVAIEITTTSTANLGVIRCLALVWSWMSARLQWRQHLLWDVVGKQH